MAPKWFDHWTTWAGPAMHRSTLHVKGCNAVKRVCKAACADNPSKMTAAKQRHRVCIRAVGSDLLAMDKQHTTAVLRTL